ncbi:serine/threonine protein kinase [Nannizzia gypsea CBS 118893]|uniref:Serine/threonine protein kinase n=1 Tax=Arthroderma gypseum (strain ATCC MYA-4604 / CBS 118893) TaxID=535722 RepID=E4V6E8_ARTGP|nr:serine/threonine protein kinase [Nannizzia gypsea CBS 118893]EFQ96664.1 serine/threonine protein kinase [Nannizzia gypsea CBS 118893]
MLSIFYVATLSPCTAPEHLAVKLAATHLRRRATQACQWKTGAFNVCYRVQFHDETPEVIVRFSSLGRTIFRAEKVANEVAVLRYLRKHTSIPVPEVYGSGKTWTGPYIVLTYIHGTPLASILKDPKVEGQPVLNPHISQRGLRRAYQEVAQLLLELSKPEFPRIGALAEEPDGEFGVSRKPFTFNINELSTSANVPPCVLPDSNRNDAATDEADCRGKFVARCLFSKVVERIQFHEGAFQLYCDDFRPSNILVDIENIRIAAAMDWEFTYVAPAEFSYVAPWWLLLQSPEDWESDLTEFLTRYTPRFHLFLDALRAAESDMVSTGRLQESQRLSPRMENSLDTQLFWVCLAARYSSMFDDIYWTFIDEVYHGKFTSLEDRLQYLSQEERTKLDTIYHFKVKQAEDGTIDPHYSLDDTMEL